ncbi:MAG: Nitrogen regulation protein NR(I) [Syntrophorhabdus sp. PtaU1.Bin050]|nr:MAG: Nitrogen regulation protein NR(I) [Syntrophorhabdus sp. PtaU1.Bin050]
MNILLVDDEPDICVSLSSFLTDLGHTVICASNGLEGLRKFHLHGMIDLVITDIRMPDMDGLELLRRIKEVERSHVEVVIITGHGDTNNAIKALRYGAFDYVQKPLDIRELVITIQRCDEINTLRNNYMQLKRKFREKVARETDTLRGEARRLWEVYIREIGLNDFEVYSEAMRQVLNVAEKYAMDREVPVLIEGESGTGKELIARFIHYYGRHDGGAFVPINCAGIPHDLFETELFGHEKGAYTGATTTGSKGKIEAADKGTIFLDEIGELPLDLQVKLLRVLEDKKFYRVGGVKEVDFTVRFVCATNKNLSKEVEANRFRLDLFYRINMGVIRIPALRERREDIVPLAIGFAKRAFARMGKSFKGFAKPVEQRLVSLPWPGNVRQLRNVVERVSLASSTNQLTVHELMASYTLTDINMRNNEKEVLSLDGQKLELPDESLDLEKFTKCIIQRALEKHGWNQTLTAKYLGISRRSLQGRIKKMELSGPSRPSPVPPQAADTDNPGSEA